MMMKKWDLLLEKVIILIPIQIQTLILNLILIQIIHLIFTI
jgi:hypothetical protein